MVRPIFKTFNIKNFNNNFFLINKFSYNKKLWIVIKADAYGHGIKNIYKFLYNKVYGFAVVSIDEAILLRNLGFKGYILLLEGFFDIEEVYLCLKFDFIIVIHSIWQINILKKIKFISKKIDVYLKFNNDLNRLGFNLDYIKRVYFLLKNINIISSISLIFHLSKSGKYDSKKNYIINYNKIMSLNLYFNDISIFSSSGLIWHLNNVFTNSVRIGILLYGGSPTGNFNDIKKYGFKPVITFNSRIISIRKVKTGCFVGYNNSYFFKKSTILGIVCCGYADGYPRQLSNKSFVLVNNIFKAKIVGFISMDMLIIDLLDNKYINIGDIVELWGENIYIDYVAKLANTISYNLMCSINNKRVKFEYKY